MRFEMEHPTDPDVTAAYGFDRTVDYFCTIEAKDKVIDDYDRLTDPENNLVGILRVLHRHGFIVDECSPEAALTHLRHIMSVDEIEDDDDVKRAAEVILNVRGAVRQAE